MENEIIINIPSAKNGEALISIWATLLNHYYNNRNHILTFNINNVEPDNVTIPETSKNISENIIVMLNKTKISSSNWRICKNGNNYMLKTYPNPLNMILDKESDTE